MKLSNIFYLVHAHGNNFESINFDIPGAIELTYVNKRYFDKKPELNNVKFPIEKLDYPNCIDKCDINLDFPQYRNF